MISNCEINKHNKQPRRVILDFDYSYIILIMFYLHNNIKQTIPTGYYIIFHLYGGRKLRNFFVPIDSGWFKAGVALLDIKLKAITTNLGVLSKTYSERTSVKTTDRHRNINCNRVLG